DVSGKHSAKRGWSSLTRAVPDGPRYGHARSLPYKTIFLKGLFPFPQQLHHEMRGAVYTLVFKQPDVANVQHVTESRVSDAYSNGRPQSGHDAPNGPCAYWRVC